MSFKIALICLLGGILGSRPSRVLDHGSESSRSLALQQPVRRLMQKEARPVVPDQKNLNPEPAMPEKQGMAGGRHKCGEKEKGNLAKKYLKMLADEGILQSLSPEQYEILDCEINVIDQDTYTFILKHNGQRCTLVVGEEGGKVSLDVKGMTSKNQQCHALLSLKSLKEEETELEEKVESLEKKSQENDQMLKELNKQFEILRQKLEKQTVGTPTDSQPSELMKSFDGLKQAVNSLGDVTDLWLQKHIDSPIWKKKAQCTSNNLMNIIFRKFVGRNWGNKKFSIPENDKLVVDKCGESRAPNFDNPETIVLALTGKVEGEDCTFRCLVFPTMALVQDYDLKKECNVLARHGRIRI